MDSLPVKQSEPIDGEIVVGRLRVSPQEISAFVDDREIQLTFKEFNLLAILARNHGRVVTRETVEAEVWGGVAPGRTIDVHMARLRSKLPSGTIKTVVKVGHKLLT